MLLLVTF